jgi:acyl carrier protein
MQQPPQTIMAPAGQPVSADDAMRHLVMSIVADVLDIKPDDAGEEAALFDLGAESLGFVEIVLKLESTFGIQIDRAYALPGPHMVGDYVAAVRGGLAQKGSGTS